MLKKIFAATLTFSLLATAPAVANPLNLFIQQCLRYQPSLSELDLTRSVSQQAVQFEQLTLGLNNINDRLNYYRDLAINSQRESILMCQLHLADELQTLLLEPKLDQLIMNLSQSQPPYSSLAETLTKVKQRQLDINTKSQLHNAQATIRRNLTNQHIAMVFNDKTCQLPTQTSHNSDTPTANSMLKTTKPNLDVSLAKYLMSQPNEQCRKNAWLAYQSRAKDKNAASLDIIKQLLQATAFESLNTQILNVALLNEYLQQQTSNINLAPWNIGQHLASLPHQPYSGPLSANEIFTRVFTQLENLGIRIEALNLSDITDTKTVETSDTKRINTKDGVKNIIYRVWHQQRLLGELFVSPTGQTNAHVIRYPVIGHQFAQASISYSEAISNKRQANKLINAIAEAVTGLARGNKFYLINKQGKFADNHLLGQYWLSAYLRQQNDSVLSQREQVVQAYRRQLRVIRSKVIIDFYLNEPSKQQQLSMAFKDSFNQEWQYATDLAFSFNGIANEGVNYYLPLWHQSLVSMIFESSKSSVTERQVFDILVVNEDNLPLMEQMFIILTPPNDPSSLIRRAFNAGHSQK